MSELVHKYRPSNLEDLVGLKDIIAYVNGGDISHALLFHGNSGVGKTTVARIIANKLGAETIEINAADQRGVDSARELIEIIDKPTLSSKPNLFIIDEAHQLSSAAQNALLKPIGDDGLEQDYIVFCTTLPSKIIKTLRSRFQEFFFKDLTYGELNGLIDSILVKENIIDFPSEARSMILEKSEGSARTCVILLDKYLTTRSIEAVAGHTAEEDENFFSVYNGIWNISGDCGVEELINRGSQCVNPEALRIYLLNMFHKNYFSKGTTKSLKCLRILLDCPPLILADKKVRLSVLLYDLRNA